MCYLNRMYKINKMLITVLAVMGFISAKAQTTLPGSIAEVVKENPSAKAVLENIMTRTSIRKFKQQPVEDAKIEALLRAGMAAPTSGDKQPWHFVVLKEKKDIEKYAESNKFHAEDIKKLLSLSLSVQILLVWQRDRVRNSGYKICQRFQRIFF